MENTVKGLRILLWGTILELVAALLSIIYAFIDTLMLFSTAFALSSIYGFSTHAVRALVPLYGLFLLRGANEYFKKAFWMRILSALMTYILLLNSQLNLMFLPAVPAHVIDAVIAFVMLFFIYRGIIQIANDDNNMHKLSKQFKRFYLPRAFFEIYTVLPYALIMLFVVYIALATGAPTWEALLPDPYMVSYFVDSIIIVLPLLMVLGYELYLLRSTYKSILLKCKKATLPL